MTPALAGAIVCPYRFTDRPSEFVEFLQLIGMRVLRRQRDFVLLGGRSGRIAVHPLDTAVSTSAVCTSLVLMVPDARAAADSLAEARLDAAWWDEAFGRQATVSGPVGTVSLDGEPDDDYGYEVGDERPSDAVDVVATVFSRDLDRVEGWFRTLGFARGEDASPDWRPLRAASGSGIVGLHRSSRPDSGTHDSATTEIGLETREQLDELAQRLRSAGHPVDLVVDSGPLHLVVTDPDGVAIEVYRVA